MSEALPDWVLEAEAGIVERFDAMLAPLVAKAIEIHVGSFTADAADAVTVEWHLAVEEFIADDVAEVWLTAVLEASGQVPDTPADFPEVVNKNGIEYQEQATNRIVGATNDLWGEINDQIVTNLVMGMDVSDLSDEVEKISGFSSRRAATIARTETLAAYNNGDWAGVKALGEFGPTHRQWVTSIDGRQRDSHLKANGQVRKIDEPFLVGGESMMHPHAPDTPAREVVNCVTGDSVVVPVGGLRSISRAWWSGPLLKFRTADGESLTVTPNHPVLTLAGWKAAQAVKAGDQLLTVRYPGVDPDDENGPSSVQQLYDACRSVEVPVVVGRSMVNFHGDRPDSEVEVVRADSVLRDRVAREQVGDLSLVGLGDAEGLGAGGSVGHRTVQRVLGEMVADTTVPDTTVIHGRRRLVSSPGLVRRRREPPSFVWRHALQPEPVGVGAGTGRHAEVVEAQSDDVAGHAERGGDGEQAVAALVAVTDVVKVENEAGRHVYSLESGSGLLWSPLSLHSNCRCTTVNYWPDDDLLLPEPEDE